jgi:DNA-binding response OmpR family regulator
MEAHRLEILRAGPLEIRPEESLALVSGRPLLLSVREMGLLVALARRPERITRREELFGVVWGGMLRPGDRSVDVYVHKLRTKLEAAMPGWRHIHTHVGFGYRFSAEPLHHFHKDATSR